MHVLDRRGLLALGAATAMGARATPGEPDLAWARLALGGEVLAAEFYRRASRLPRAAAVRAQEVDHYRSLAAALAAAGQQPAQHADFRFTFPRGAFADRSSTAQLGLHIESALVGLYLGGAESIVDDGLRTQFARIAACEARHQSLFAQLGPPFPAPLAIDQASAALDPYLG
jgi:hypothetical protein